MEVKKDIGKAFREKLDSLDRQPGDALWNSISTELDKKKKRRFPFFWFYITTCTLIGIGVAAFIFSNVTSTGNTPTTNKSADTTNQIQTSGSPAATSAENHSGNENTATGVPSVNGTATPDNKNTDASTGVNTTTNKSVKSTKKNLSNDDSSNGNSPKNNIIKNSTTQNSSIGQSVAEKAVSQKNSAQEDNTKAEKTLRQKAKYSGRNAVANSENINNGKSNNKLSDPSDSSGLPIGSKASSASGSKRAEHAEHSDSITAVDTNNLKTDGKRQNTTSEKQTENSSENRETTVSTIGNSEIVTREKASAAVHDSLTENIPAPKDSITTETPKEEVATEEKKENKKDSIRPTISKRLSVFAFGGPSLFNFPNSSIKTDSTTANISTTSPLRYGVLLGYRINEKFSIRAGLSFYKIKQSAKSLKLNYTMGGSAINPVFVPPTDFDWIDYNSGTNNASIITALGNDNRAIVNIDREMSYIEIPLEATYTIYSRKFGIDLIAGGSMLLLSKNDVTASNANGQLQLGEWNAAKKTSFTGTFGLGLNYKITPSLQLNAEPVFNYYFNTYNDSKPYSFTFRVGLQYNFDF